MLAASIFCPALTFSKLHHIAYTHRRSNNSPLFFSVGPSEASLIAGGLGGACGVGLSFPLDSLKTKIQLSSHYNNGQGSAGSFALETSNDPIAFAISVYKFEGVSGFFNGVRTTVLGQACIKSLAFSSNTFALDMISHDQTPSLKSQVMAACFSGFVVSFLVVPLERIKVESQARNKRISRHDDENKLVSVNMNEIKLALAIVEQEGLLGFFLCGIGLTLAREIPSYVIDFVTYRVLMNSLIACEVIGPCTSLVCGAIAGCMCWVSVYPIDFIKTFVQKEGNKKIVGQVQSQQCVWKIARALYLQGGIRSFYRGFFPVLVRSALSHSITFWVHDASMALLESYGIVSQAN
ncbi:hypothetical protein ACHAXS_012475 [Conticribra weissflogii]